MNLISQIIVHMTPKIGTKNSISRSCSARFAAPVSPARATGWLAKVVATFALAFMSCTTVFAQTVTTIAGTGSPSYSGDGGLAANAAVNAVNSLRFGPDGSLYLADSFNRRVRKISTSGIITTIAGNGSPGSEGDGGLAVNARLQRPSGVAVDAEGNIYIADLEAHRIRRVSVDGRISTFAGTGVAGYGGDGGLAINAQINSPYDVAVDSNGNLLIADSVSGAIRRVSPNGTITTIAGTGVWGHSGDGGSATAARMNLIFSLALDRAGNLYAVEESHRIRRITPDGIISTVAGSGLSGSSGDGGPATSARLFNPWGVAIDDAGNLYIGDGGNRRIRKVDANGVITTVPSGISTGDGLLSRVEINPERGFATDTKGNLYFSERNKVRQISGLLKKIPISLRGGLDLDGEGKSALVVANTSSQQLTAGRLVGSTIQWTNLPGPGTDFRVIAPIDFAGNGKSDLPMLRETPLNANGQGSAQFWTDFSNSAPVLLRDVRPAWDVQAVGDLDGDGFGDLVWRFRGQSPNIDDQGVSYIWFTNGTGVAQVRKRGGAPLTWTLLGAADLNGDGAADMIYVSPTSTMRVLMATPNRTCANLSGGSIPSGFAPLKIADFTNQGRGGILIRSATTGEVRLLGLNATGLTLPPYTGAPDDPNASCTSSTLSVTQTNTLVGTTDPTWTLYATGDFNGDGAFDIVWRRPDNTLTLWQMATNGAVPTVINNVGTVPANSVPLPLQ